MRRSTRRSFLRAVGAGLATLPFVNMLGDSVAKAGGEELPLRFVGIYHPHGIAAEYWAMREGDTETSFDIAYPSCSLQPFDDPATYGKSFKDKILVVEGLDLLSNANGHDTAGTILTGSRIDGKKPLNISLDQYLAVEKGLGADTRITSVALSVGVDTSESGTTLSYGAGGAPLPKIINPVEAFDLLFAGLVVGDDPEAQAKAARQRELGQSVIDFVRGDVNRLRTRLAPAEQQKLDQHLTALRELEKQFAAPGAGRQCVVPPKPDATKFPSLKQYNQGEPYFDAITDAHIDVLAQALACDVTRFATLFLNDLSFDGNPLNLPKDNHGSIAHTYDASPIGNNGRPGAGKPETWLPLATFNRYSYSKIARLMQRLDELGVLDSTLIYATSDMGNPALHSTRNVPTLLAGGANGKFRMGRRIRLKADCPADLPYCGESDAAFTPVANSKLLVSIAQAFGVETESFGSQADPGLTTGALSELV
ncbi:uncharacterized protein SOCE26_020130 [Sorangium cellulosum]|uniref:DUF1552 domain-containing protein n=1 Tax=Sorangium cellulosum TaxID=56 RepID=A0A2L0EMY1_SORCE|nr:DUF1552 domain-containing protein [Sorangium cellulosum]AUX40612.1 uncharacterized protein SOCE26_020130 [Sorangium cellulosum]